MGETFSRKAFSEAEESESEGDNEVHENEEIEKDQPIRLVLKDKNNKLIINSNALKHLAKIRENFGVLVVVGPYRQGKSFLLNQIMGRMNGFGVGHKDHSHTKGVWMWPDLVEAKRENGEIVKMLLLDTEGLESDENSEEWNDRLFLLSLLLSSLFIYNTKNALEKSAFQKLAAMSIISQQVKVSSSKSGSKTVELSSECPSFIWVVRDFSLESTISPLERLQRFLTPEEFEENGKLSVKENEKKRLEISHRNSLRAEMEDVFKSLNAFYLPVPVSDGVANKTYEEALQSLDSLKPQQLRPAFQTSIKKLTSLIHQTIEEKQVNNLTMNGAILAQYLKFIVDNLNQNKTIYLHETVSLSVKTVCDKIVSDMKEKYVERMEDLVSLNTLPIKWAVFQASESEVRDECLEVLSCQANDESALYRNVFLEFKEFRKEKYFYYSAMNQKEIEKYNGKVIEKVWRDEMAEKCQKGKVEYKSKREFLSDLERFKVEARKKMFECENFGRVWSELCERIGYDEIEGEVDECVERARKELELKAVRDAEERMRKEMEEKARLEKLEIKRKAIEDRERVERERKEAELKAAEKVRRDYEEKLQRERNEAEARVKEAVEKAVKETQLSFHTSKYLLTPTSSQSTRYNAEMTPSRYMDTPPATPIKADYNNYSPVSSRSSQSSLNESASSRTTTKGLPDMRYKANRVNLVSDCGVKLKMDGTPDMRFTENKIRFSKR